MKVEGVKLNSLRAREAKQGQPVAPHGSAARHPHLAVGEELNVSVAGRLARSRYLVNVRGSLLETTAAGEFNVGDSLAVRVEQLQPQIVLRLKGHAQGETGQALHVLRTLLPQHGLASSVTGSEDSLLLLLDKLRHLTETAGESLPASVRQLQARLAALIPEGSQLRAEQLTTLIRDTGQQYEAKLLGVADPSVPTLQTVTENDVKGLLLQALDEMLVRSHSSTDVAPLAQHVTHIERQQVLNVIAQIQDAPLQFQLPLLSDDVLTSALFSLEKDDGDGNGTAETGASQAGYRILFLLDLDGLGQTKIDAHLTEQAVHATFYVEQQKAEAFLRPHLAALQEALYDLGYESVSLASQPLSQLSGHQQRKFKAITREMPHVGQPVRRESLT